tara:strand:+ start:7334 stop:7450 length:117 start_codon:yes stop_codon:yes gene_type:complete
MQGLSLGLGKGMWKGEAGKVYSCEYRMKLERTPSSPQP